ncbi:MAG: YdcH family protein [Rhodoferax sp.]
MFSEYTEQVNLLKAADAHFCDVFDRHDALDQKIKRMEAHQELGTTLEIEQLKKENLALKDQVWTQLRRSMTQ